MTGRGLSTSLLYTQGMRNVTLAVLLLGLTATAQASAASTLGGQWQGQAGEQSIHLTLAQQAGNVIGTADLGFAWNTAERQFDVTGQLGTDSADLKLLNASGQPVYLLACRFTTGWHCTLSAESGVRSPRPGIALSAAWAWAFALNAVQ